MRVLHVTGMYPTENNPIYGISVKTQIESLQEKGIDCEICVLNGTGLIKYITGIFHIRKYLKNNKFDLIHAHFMYAGWSARFASKLPLLVSFLGSDIYGYCGINGDHKIFSQIVQRKLSYILSLFSAKSISMSTRMSNLLPSENVEIIPPGINLKIFKPITINKEEIGLSKNVRYILFPSSPERLEKRYELAIDSIRILKKRYPNVELLHFGGLKRNEVINLINACDCILLTSKHEGSPNVIKEALACNTPVISVDVGDVKERIDGVQNCYLVSSKPEDIADTLYMALRKNQRALNGYEKIQEFSQENIASKIIVLYNSMMN